MPATATATLVEALLGTASVREDFMKVFEHVPIGVVLVDRDQNFLAGNPALAEFLGYNTDELHTLTITSISHPEDLGPALAMRQQILSGRRTAFETEKRYVCKDGTVVWGKLMVGSVGSVEGGLTVAIIEDITARKQADREIAQVARQMEIERNFYLAAFKYLPNGVLIALPTGEIVYHNQQVERIWGITVPRHLRDLEKLVKAFHPDGTPLTRDEWPLVRALEHGEYVAHEMIKNVLPDGSIIHMHSTGAPVRDPEGQIVAAVGVLSDVTPMVAAEEQRERLVRELEAAQGELQRHRDFLEDVVKLRTQELEDRQARLRELAGDMAGAEHRERTRIAANIHNEIAQTLASVKMGLSALQVTIQPDQVREALPAVIQLVDEAISQARAIMAELSPPVLTQHGLVAALRWWAARVTEQHHLQVHVAAPDAMERLDPQVEVIIFQAAKELIHNSVKYAEASRIDVTVGCDDGVFTLEAKDDGRGFDPATIRPTEHGGFGLTHMRERVSYLGGTMEIQSAPGAGTTATLALPLNCRLRTEHAPVE